MEHEWRCRECGTLLGIEQGARLTVRYKQAQYVIDGASFSVMAVCRCCHVVNQRDVITPSGEPTTSPPK